MLPPYRPAGAGPFPAIVLAHTCAGVGNHTEVWGGKLASWGYVVFSIDHPGTNRTVRFADGTAFTMDTLTFPAHDRRQHFTGAGQPHHFVPGRFAERLDVASRSRIVGIEPDDRVLTQRLRQHEHRHGARLSAGVDLEG